MKFNWNPALFSEAVRQVVLALVLFGILQVTEIQLTGGLMALSAVLALFTLSATTPNSTIENAGSSKTQMVEAARANAAAGTPGGTGAPDVPGGAGGPDAPRGLGNFSSKDTRGGTGVGMLILLLIPALFLAGCNRPITPTEGARVNRDVLELANDAHKAVFDGYVAGTIPGPQADPFMNGVELRLIPAARKTMTALKAWQAATTVDLKAIKAGDLTKALDALDMVALDLFGAALPPGVASAVSDTASSIRRSIDALKAAIRTATSGAFIDASHVSQPAN